MRRLTTILFSDIHGFSRQMSVDEQGMLARLAEHNRIFQEEFARHEGRVVKKTGDGFMAEFQSAVAAVTCAVAVQRALSRRAVERPEEPGIGVRIGVHLGDVTVSADGDLLGDAVNIAARLEQICPVGSVCVSHSVYEQARGRINAEGESLGHVRLKNIARKVRVYVLHPADARLTVSGIHSKLERPKPPKTMWVALAAGSALAVAGLAWLASSAAGDSGPTRGGVLRVASTLERGQLRAYGSFRGQYATATAEVLEPLIAFGTGTEYAPSVLERLEEREGGKQLLLHLRPGVRFHPHPCLPDGKGREAQPEDVVYSLEVGADQDALDAPLQGLSIANACPPEARPDDPCEAKRHVVVQLAAPSAFFDQDLSAVVLLPRELKGCEDLTNLRQPVGTGPLAFTGPPTSDDLVVARFDGSWRRGLDGDPLPYVDRLELRLEPDIELALGRLGRGELEVVTLTVKEADRLIEQGQDGPRLKGRFADLKATVAPHVAPGITFAGLYLTGRQGPLTPPKVRKALSVAMDRARLLEKLSPGATPSDRLLDAKLMGATPGPTPKPNAAGARALLEGERLASEILIAHTTERREVCALLAEDARAAGLTVRCLELSLAAISDRPTQLTFDAFLSASPYTIRGTEPWPFVAHLATSTDYRDAPAVPFAPTVARLNAERDRTARAAIYRELEARLLEQLAIIPIGIGRTAPDAYLAYWIVRDGVKGLIDPTTGRAATEPRPYSNAWLAR